MSLFIAVSHAAHVPSRVEAFEALRSRLPRIDFLLSEKMEDVFQIGPRMWKEALLSDADHALFLDDDAIVREDFYPVLEKVIAACPDKPIALHCNGLKGPELRKAHRWYTSAEGLVGVGYVLPRPFLLGLVDAYAEEFTELVRREIPNDTQVNLYAMSRGIRIHHPLPGLVDHPAENERVANAHESAMPSTCPPEPGMLELDWTVQPDTPHIGRHYQGNQWLLITGLEPEYRKPIEAYNLLRVHA